MPLFTYFFIFKRQVAMAISSSESRERIGVNHIAAACNVKKAHSVKVFFDAVCVAANFKSLRNAVFQINASVIYYFAVCTPYCYL